MLLCTLSKTFRTLWVGSNWGTRAANGTWTGMTRQLTEGVADMIAASLDINEERNNAIDFVWPMIEITDVIVIK